MFIELEPIFNNVGLKKEFIYSFCMDDSGVDVPVQVSGTVENRAGVVTLTSDISFQDSVPCDRCLKPTPRAFQKQFTHVLTPTLNDADNDDFILIEDMHFDLDALLREDVLLACRQRFCAGQIVKGFVRCAALTATKRRAAVKSLLTRACRFCRNCSAIRNL